MKTLVGFAIAGIITAIFGAGVANAQYPAPVGSVQALAGATVATVGGLVPITGVVTSSTGQPVANTQVTIAIESEPGGPNGDAEIGSKVTTRVTDAQGRAFATLRTGSTPGIIAISITAANGLRSQVLVTVTGPAPVVPLAGGVPLIVAVPGGSVAAPPAPVASTAGLPPAAPIDVQGTGLGTITPPSTGDAGLASSTHSNASLALIAVAALAVAGAGIGSRRSADGC